MGRTQPLQYCCSPPTGTCTTGSPRKGPWSWRWMLALSALDLAMLSAGVAAHRGFESPFFVGYYPSLALFAVVFGSVRLTLVWVTMAAAVYAALCLAVEPGLDFSANDEEILLIRVAGMYTVVVVVNLISRVERIRRMEAVERERALQRERIELSHAIHKTMAQSANMIGVGIERAKELADIPDLRPAAQTSLRSRECADRDVSPALCVHQWR